jgi:predicted SAM-dependent methyltransferase
MVNEGMRSWGHVFVYDEPELVALLKECGYSDIRRVKWGESDHPELRGLESRPDFEDLILEARA